MARAGTLLAASLFAVLPFTAPANTLSVKDWIRPPEYRQAIVSPDGKYLAVVMTLPHAENRYELAVMTTDSVLMGKPHVTARIGLAAHELFAQVFWANNDRVLMATARYFGGFDRPYLDGNLLSISAHGGRAVLLMGPNSGNELGYLTTNTRKHAYFSYLISRLRKERNMILVAGFNGESDRPSAYRLDVVTGSSYRIATAPFGGGMLADHDGRLRLEWGFNEETGWPKLLYRPLGSMNWKDVSSLVAQNKTAAAALETGGPTLFGPHNKSVYVEYWADNPAETMGLYRYNFDTGKKTLLYANPSVDVGDVIESFDRKSLVGLNIELGKPETLALNIKAPRMQLLAALKKALPNVQVGITSWTNDGERAVVKTWSDTVSPAFYLYSSKPKPSLELLFRSTPWIKSGDLSLMRPISYKSRDGLTIHGYLTLPRNAATKNLPMVVYVHGGPYGIRVTWGFSPWDFDSVIEQLLANHGYAVLAVNYRGSGGYGFKFLEAGFRHWGDTMQNDLADGVNWAVKQGIADPRRVCILGASYGGYAALMSSERFPDLFRCAVGYSGVYNLFVLKSSKSGIARWAGGRLYENTVLGSNAKQLKAFSPALNAEKLKIPVFLLHGGRDEIAPVKGYEQMVAAIKKNGTPLKTLYEPNEGHSFYQPAHREKAWNDILAFLGKYIGPAGATPSNPGSDTH